MQKEYVWNIVRIEHLTNAPIAVIGTLPQNIDIYLR
jgi:hypothetical protein